MYYYKIILKIHKTLLNKIIFFMKRKIHFYKIYYTKRQKK